MWWTLSGGNITHFYWLVISIWTPGGYQQCPFPMLKAADHNSVTDEATHKLQFFVASNENDCTYSCDFKTLWPPEEMMANRIREDMKVIGLKLNAALNRKSSLNMGITLRKKMWFFRYLMLVLESDVFSYTQQSRTVKDYQIQSNIGFANVFLKS